MGVAWAVELFFVVAITDAIGGEAISKRIEEQLGEHVQQSRLNALDFPPVRCACQAKLGRTIEKPLEQLAAGIQQLINVEISSRRVVNA
jgi:hypothetical protein